MPKLVLKVIAITLPCIFAFLIFIVGLMVSSLPNYTLTVSAYPPPVNSSQTVTLDHELYMPLVHRPWQLANIEAPFSSISLYISTFNNNALYNAGCEQGTRDYNQAGTQDSIVFLHFGQPWQIDGQYGVRLNDTYAEKTVSEIRNAVLDYASGYYYCVSSDYYSRVTIAVGLNNDSDYYTTYSHGMAWGTLIDDINNDLFSYFYYLQVSVAGANDMELGFNSPLATRAWVDGYTESVLNPNYDPKFILFDIADAAGCEPYYGDCGTVEYPEWEQEDVWYIAYGCLSCQPLPMIYSQSWSQAEQWQHMSRYSVDLHGYKIVFAGTITQHGACIQREDEYCSGLGNLPEIGYKQLYTVLNAVPELAQDVFSLKWSTDIEWLE